jgi:tripartite-type tricarboxylate transporter receptor subunit TctC
MNVPRRALLLAGLAAGCSRRNAPGGCAALAGRAVRWIVPYSPGGSYDVYSRLLKAPLERLLRVKIAVVNETGASSLVGVSKLRDAAPDGLTLGIFNAPGLLAAAALGRPRFPDPVRDFSILGRVSRSRKALATRAGSPLRSFEDVFEAQRCKPLLCGTTGVSSDNFLNLAVAGSLLGLRLQFLFGHAGSREEILAALRGDVDMISLNYETIQPAVESGELRVLLQCSDEPLSPHPALAGAALLGGADGWAVRRAPATNRTPAQAAALADSLIRLIGSGIIAAAPPRLPGDLLACLRSAFLQAASSDDFLDAARRSRRSVDAGEGEPVRRELEAASMAADSFAPLLREAAGKAYL